MDAFGGGAKRKRDYESGADVISSTLSRLEEEAAAAAAAATARPFVPSAAWAGARPGYFFGRGAQGQGYYAERAAAGAAGLMPPPAPRGAPAEAAPRRAAAAPVSGAQLLEQAEREAGGIEVDDLDVRAVRRAVLGLERRLNENLAARMKYADAPEKFIDSEVDLHEEVKRLGTLAAAPELYPELVRLGAVPSLLALLTHENADIAAEGAQLLRELTDADAATESDAALAGAAALAEALAGPAEGAEGDDADATTPGGGLPALVAAMSRFDEKVAEEASAVQALLGVCENLVEVSPVLRDRLLAPHTGLLQALLARVTARGAVDGNKVAAAELLAVLLTGSDAAAAALGEGGGVDALLRAIAPFKRGKAKGKAEAQRADADEETEAEFVENCFDALCCAVMLDANKLRFVEAEGVELMLLVIRGKGRAKTAALRALDFAATRCAPAAARLVQAGGLGALFAAFSGRSAEAARARRGADAADAEEARAVSLLASLMALLPRGSVRDRVAAKFVEDEFAKVDRLAELWFKYSARVAAAEAAIAQEEDDDDDDDDDDVAEERYAQRLDAGLYTLQQIALVVAQLWCVGHEALCARVARALALGGASLAAVRAVLREHAANVGDAEGEEAQEGLQRRLEALTRLLYAPDEARSREASDDEAAEEEQREPAGGEEAEMADAGAEAEAEGAAGGAGGGGRVPPAEGMVEDADDDA